MKRPGAEAGTRRAEQKSDTITIHFQIIFIFSPDYLKRPGAEAGARRRAEQESVTITVHS